MSWNLEMNKQTLTDVDVRNKTVLLRADLNVPIDKEGLKDIASHHHRLRSTMPSIQHLIENNSKIIICSHLGRPNKKIDETLRMEPVAKQLSKLLGRPVRSMRDCIGPNVQLAVSELQSGDLLLLENLRFYPGEEENNPDFARALAGLADLFVMDAFGTAHRPHASVIGVPQYIPSVAGLLLQKEVTALSESLNSPDRPLGTILGGAKVSDKILILNNLLTIVDKLFIGGGMATTFLKAQGHPAGASLVEEDMLGFVSGLMKQAESTNVEIHLPIDLVVSSASYSGGFDSSIVKSTEIPNGSTNMDIGPETIAWYSKKINECKTVIWNGPLGVVEYPDFTTGTYSIAKTVSTTPATTIIGGGSTADTIYRLGLASRMDHVSSGGGAMLQFLEGRELCGIDVLPSNV